MSQQPSNIMIFITAVNTEEAAKIAGVLLTQKKIACTNIIPSINSMYWWKGQIESTQESMLIIKTRASQLQEIIDEVKKIHSYEVPEIIALPVIGGSSDYLSWIDSEVKKT